MSSCKKCGRMDPYGASCDVCDATPPPAPSQCNHTFHRLGGIDDCPVCRPETTSEPAGDISRERVAKSEELQHEQASADEARDAALSEWFAQPNECRTLEDAFEYAWEAAIEFVKGEGK